MGTEQCDLYEKTAQFGSECCLDNEQKMLGSVLTNSVIDENSNQVSVNMTELLFNCLNYLILRKFLSDFRKCMSSTKYL